MANNHQVRICAAGVPSKSSETVADLLSFYPLVDQVDALLNDKIEPTPPPLKKKYKFTERPNVADLINPPIKSKFEVITQDFKETVYDSYWKNRLGKSPDQVPMFPDGYDTQQSFGKKIKIDEVHGFDLLYPKDLLLDTPKSQQPGFQTNRNYCRPAFSKDYTYGICNKVDYTGGQVKCCLQQDEVKEGKAGYTVNCGLHSKFQDRTLYKPGRQLNNDIFETIHPPLPAGYCFGKPSSSSSSIAECLTDCHINSEVIFIRECLAHINVVRKNNEIKWKRDPGLFHGLFEKFKWFDIDHSKFYTKWLPKEMVYDKLRVQNIVVNPNLVEPLLEIWRAFDGENIEYGTLLRLVNFREPIPKLPKMCDVEPSCLDFRTTYKEMTKPGQCVEAVPRSAGVLTIRFDMDLPVTPEGLCRAYKLFLGDETDVRCCLNPSLMTQYNITHRDIYTKREPEQLRMIFEKAGYTFTDEDFYELWEKAKEYHPDGIVCIETFNQVAKLFIESVREEAIAEHPKGNH